MVRCADLATPSYEFMRAISCLRRNYARIIAVSATPTRGDHQRRVTAVTVPGEMTAAAQQLAERYPDLDPDEFVEATRAFTRRFNTLPPVLSRLRREALRKIRDEGAAEGRLIKWVARRAGFAPHRFSKLTRAAEAVSS